MVINNDTTLNVFTHGQPAAVDYPNLCRQLLHSIDFIEIILLGGRGTNTWPEVEQAIYPHSTTTHDVLPLITSPPCFHNITARCMISGIELICCTTWFVTGRASAFIRALRWTSASRVTWFATFSTWPAICYLTKTTSPLARRRH